MNLFDFSSRFPDESSCREVFKAHREQEGIHCRRCGCSRHYWKRKRQQWECKDCAFRTTLRSGTVMQGSKLSFLHWFKAMALMSSTKKSFSAKEVQRQLGHCRYQPVWEMMHKIRAVMGLRDDTYQLNGRVEADEAFFVTVDENRPDTLKRGRGSERQTTVMVLAESKVKEGRKPKKPGRPTTALGHIKMKMMRSTTADTISEKGKKTLDTGTDLVTDGFPSYNELGKDLRSHTRLKVPPKEAGKLLPWVHIEIANAKRLLLDIHHRIDSDFLENYLNEFCYKANRKYFDDIFDRLIIACLSFRWNWLGETYG